MAVLTIKNLCKSFNVGTPRASRVLNDISFEVKGQTFVSIVGPSGCGKSTLLNIISGVEKHTSGNISLTSEAGGEARIGYVFQDPRLLPWRNVMKNMMYVQDSRDGATEARARKYLDMVGLSKNADFYPGQLSGGMQQRVGIARAFAVEPDLLLMDEPFSHLDAITARGLRAQLQDIWEQSRKTVVFVTHDVVEAVELSDRIIVLQPGGKIFEDIPIDLPRPRRQTDPHVATLQAEVLARLETMKAIHPVGEPDVSDLPESPVDLPVRQHATRNPVSKQLKAPASAGAAQQDDVSVREVVRSVIEDVRRRGDDAVRYYSEKFDSWSPDSFRLSVDETANIVDRLSPQVVADIVEVQANVREFAQYQLASMHEFEVETKPGVLLGQKHLPISAAGAYVPGGRYALTASAHMTVVTAKVAGVERVTACTPPIRGELPTATIAALHLAGADEIMLLGGVQAVAALAFGTESIDKVDIIAGPGNAFVAEAKRQLFGEVGIDLFAGPTEILIVADDDADPFVVAVDLLSQAEHGPDSPAVLITTSERLARRTMQHVEALLPGMSTNDMAGPAWRDHGEVHVVDTIEEAYRLADSIASEHVQILTREPREALEQMSHYGALFLGEGTCVSYGDKVIGTNHVLPTRGAARYTGGLWVGKYLRTVTYQEVTDTTTSADLGELCGRTARVELFEGHARSGDVRAAKYAGAPMPWAERNSHPEREESRA